MERAFVRPQRVVQRETTRPSWAATTAKGRLAIQRTCCAALLQRRAKRAALCKLRYFATRSAVMAMQRWLGCAGSMAPSWLAKNGVAIPIRRAAAELAAESAFVPAFVRSRCPAAPHPTRVGHAGQYAAFCLFFWAQARPFDVIAHGSFDQMADAGAAGAIAGRSWASQCRLAPSRSAAVVRARHRTGCRRARCGR